MSNNDDNTMPGYHIYQPPSVDDGKTMPGRRDPKFDRRFEIGDVIINRYRVLAELGQGGMGVVYKCFDQTAGIEVALKALPPELSHNTLEMGDIKDNFQLVHNLHHPNIASSNNLERDNSNGNYYLIMECANGVDLRHWLRQRRNSKSLTPESVLPILRQVAEALDYAHGERIIHRDIKPGNVMIDVSGHVKVLDFGLAAQIHTSMTRVSMAYHGTSGTGPYMAPEQWRGEIQDASADQYALAVMAYEMLAGHLPFESTDIAVLQQAVLTHPPKPIPGIPAAMNHALLRALNKDATKRFNSCADFVAAMEGKKVSGPVGKRNWALINTAVAIFFVAIVVGFLYWFSQEKKEEPKGPGVGQTEVPSEKDKDQSTSTRKSQPDPQQVITKKPDGKPDQKPRVDPQQKAEPQPDSVEKDIEALVVRCEELKNAKRWGQLKTTAAELKKLDWEKGHDYEETAQKELDKLQGDIYLLQDKALTAKTNVENANPDEGQTFGKHLETMNSKYKTGKLALDADDITVATNDFNASLDAANWILTNIPLRANALSLKRRLAEKKADADRYDGKKLAFARYSEAERAERDGDAKFNSGEFDLCVSLYQNAMSCFGEARDTAYKATKQKRIDACQSALNCRNWDLLVKSAEALREFDEVAANDYRNKALLGAKIAEAKRALDNGNWDDAITKANEALRMEGGSSNEAAQSIIKDAKSKKLAKYLSDAEQSASNASTEADWQKVLEYAEAALGLDPSNAKAQGLKNRAEENLTPTLNIVAYVDNQVVVPTSVEPKCPEKLEYGSRYSFRVTYKALDGTDYVGEVEQFICNWKGPDTKTVYLKKAGFNGKVRLSASESIDMIRIEPGTFSMGSPTDEPKRDSDEVKHQVKISKHFWLGETEVTYGQWKAVMGTTLQDQVRKALNDDTVYSYLGNKTLRDFWGKTKDSDPSSLIGPENDDIPMYYVSWDEAMEFCRRVTEMERKAGRLPEGYVYSLPTEAQWEYACRAGTTTALYNGEIAILGDNNAPALDAIAWYGGNSSVEFTGRGWDTSGWKDKQYPGGNAGMRKVRTKDSNAWGLYDMLGNVYEWCSDWYGKYGGDTEDPKGPETGSFRVLRGGSWSNGARDCRCADRYGNAPSNRNLNVGFRIALVLVQ